MGMSPAKLKTFRKHLKALTQRRKLRSTNESQRNSAQNLKFPKVRLPLIKQTYVLNLMLETGVQAASRPHPRLGQVDRP